MSYYKFLPFCFFSFIVSDGFALPSDSSNLKIDKRALILPVAINSPETKIGVGILTALFFRTSHLDTTVRTSNIQSVVLYTQKRQILLNLGGNIYFPKEKYILKWQSVYSYFPDKFWGIGNNTSSENKESYIYNQFYFNPQLLRKVYKRWFVGIIAEYQNVIKTVYDPQGIFYTQNVIGRNGYVASGIGPLIAWDSRNNAFSPSKGEYFQFSYLNYNKFLGSSYKFNGYIIDARKYIKSFSKNILALQLYGQFNNGNVPFRNMPALGGPNLLRGYYMGRYRDKDAIVMQGEYRMPVYKRFGIVVFGGLGEVIDKLGNLSISGLKYSTGGGIRFALKPKEKLNLRLDYAIGQKSSGLYFYVSEAF
jgi:hypothetical protein